MKRKAFLPHDSGFNRIYPFPQFILKKTVIFLLTLLVIGVAILSIKDISNNDISSKPRDRVIEYEVMQGDTLDSIAEKFSVSEDTLVWENNVNDNDLTVGSIIRIPPVTGVVHQVQKGDTIYTIAEQYNVNYQNILNFPYNEFKDYSTFELIPGTSIVVPGGSK